ncbi:hypothetical protein HIM_10785 [Hirsutella minnesotensis 3608]|uniref:Uncharacterized protein n=1 Tax=Hirsutella minnesotensis 3608 TaxID=1043627 RepID=A0A0F7ZWZ5_9HYPO|nr:hypothetical protein HIM_10785 [Hirsutella minnesotensis 3608]
MQGSEDLHLVHESHALSGQYFRNSLRRLSAESADFVLLDPSLSFYDGFYYPEAIVEPLDLDNRDLSTTPNSPTRYENPVWPSQAASLPAFGEIGKEHTQKHESHDQRMSKRKSDEERKNPTSKGFPSAKALHTPETPRKLSGSKFQSEGISGTERRRKRVRNLSKSLAEHENSSTLRSSPRNRGKVRERNGFFAGCRRSARIRDLHRSKLERAR